MAFLQSLSFASLASIGLVQALDNGFGRTPVMSFNTYNVAACTINQTWIRDSVNRFVDMGFKDAGYNQFGLDCGWQGRQRQANGSIDYDSNAFPDGIKPLSDLAISRGLQWGMYTNQGKFACDFLGPVIPGSIGYEREDALQLAGWNVAYLKVDNCWIDGPQNQAPKDPLSDFKDRFGVMQTALREVGIKGMLVCQWGVPYRNESGILYGPSEWAPALATSYRMSDDIARGWGNIWRIYNQNIHIIEKDLSGPGQFADMDMLEVGNPGMTITEQATHFAVWAFMKSPLIISTRLEGMSDQVKAILQNRGIIAVNQDPLGKPVKLAHRFSFDNDQFVGPLANGDVAILLVDHSVRRRSLGVEFPDYGIESATVTNLWTGETLENVSRYFTDVDAHGSVPLRLSNIVRKPAVPPPAMTYYEAEKGQLSGQANTQPCVGCASGQKVGFVGGGDANTLTISNILTSQAVQDVHFDYIMCDIGYLAGNGPNSRGASVSVNNGPAQSVIFPLSGYEWSRDVTKGFLVRLSGFNTTGPNTIKISGLPQYSAFAPDFDRIGVRAVETTPSPSGYSEPTPLEGAIIRAPQDCNRKSTYLGLKSFQGEFSVDKCAKACSDLSAYNRRRPRPDGSFNLCQFFNTYSVVNQSTVIRQDCALYSQTWPKSFATVRTGRSGGSQVTYANSFAVSNSTGQADQPVGCVNPANP